VNTECCPRCGATLQLIRDGLVGRTIAPAFNHEGQRLRTAWVLRRFYACSACEYCAEC
jgi:hypothetical protein